MSFRGRGILAVLAVGVLFITCGLDEDYYLSPIPVNNVWIVSSNTIAGIRLPNYPSTGGYYFAGFKLYYRIYISDSNDTAEVNTETQMRNINASLWSNYSNIYPYTDTTGTNVNTSNMANVFAGQRFYELELEGASVAGVLSTGGSTIFLDFANQVPTLDFGSPATSSYNLIRSTGEGRFNPLPEDRHFINKPELYASENTISTVNADVADNSTLSADSIRSTFVAFYIVVTGINDSNFTPIYSAPTFVGILRLPNE